MAVVSALTIASFILGWKDGVEYEGFMDTVALAMINFLLAAITLVILVLHRVSSSYVLSITFHAILFFWLAWFAMPLLGDFGEG